MLHLLLPVMIKTNKFEVSTVATASPSCPVAVSPVMELFGMRATLDIVSMGLCRRCGVGGSLCTTESENHEQDCSDIFSQHGNKVCFTLSPNELSRMGSRLPGDTVGMLLTVLDG